MGVLFSLSMLLIVRMHKAHKHSYHAKIELTRNRNRERVLDDE